MSKSVVIATALRVRQGPGMSFKTIGYLKHDDEVEVLGASPDNSWMNVLTPSGLIGWSSAAYLIALSDAPPPSDGGSGETAQCRVIASVLNLRAGPGLNYKVIGFLLRDEILQAFGSAMGGTWFNVRRANGLMGWCSAQYVTIISGTPTTPGPPAETGIHYRVTPYALNLRTGPSSTYPVVTYLRQNDLVEYLAFEPLGGWMEVRMTDGRTGWSAAKYLEEVVNPPPPPDPQPEDFNTGFQRVLVTSLDIYANPTSTGSPVARIEYEQVVDVLEITPDRLWKRIAMAQGGGGWCEARLLASLGGALAELQPDEEFPWMPIAFGELRQREIPGSPNNPRILEYLYSTSLIDLHLSLPDATDWCAAFVNWCIERAGVPSTNSAMVNPWRFWGQALQTPRRGCLVTFTWEDGGQHVAFYMGGRDDRVYVLGGNQSDAVWIKSYLTKYVTAYRIPSGWPLVKITT
jgi:uncharacterized protein (TIGR02594 family)